MSLSRRNILVLGAAGAGAFALAGVARAVWPARQFDFTAVTRPAGFRRIARSDGMTAGALLSGFEAPAVRPAPLSNARMCELVFGGKVTGQGQLAVAVFSDFFCPYCRVLDVQVRDLAAADDRIAVVPHEVPLLGVPSQLAARAVIAAEAQGASEAFHRRLIRTRFVATPAYLRDIATEEGIDVAAFTQDMQSEATSARISDSIALFRAFGFVGTPALVVGKTLVNGAIRPRDLQALMDIELQEDGPPLC